MPYRFRSSLWCLLALLLLAPAQLRAQSASIAAQNKQLFDRAVDELNFRTMETVYDKSFTRRKYPVTLRTAKARKEFDDYPGRDDLKRLFRNYNDAAERFKSRYGKGRTDLPEFERQLNSVLVDRNFEFFISKLPRDERVALIRSLQRYIKQATAQFNASEDPEAQAAAEDAAAVPPADVDAQPEPATTTETVASEPNAMSAAPDAYDEGPALRQPTSNAPARHDWLDYVTLLCSLASLGLLAYLTTSVIPGLRAQINALTFEEGEEETPTEPVRRTSAGLPEDRYDDDEIN